MLELLSSRDALRYDAVISEAPNARACGCFRRIPVTGATVTGTFLLTERARSNQATLLSSSENDQVKSSFRSVNYPGSLDIDNDSCIVAIRVSIEGMFAGLWDIPDCNGL